MQNVGDSRYFCKRNVCPDPVWKLVWKPGGRRAQDSGLRSQGLGLRSRRGSGLRSQVSGLRARRAQGAGLRAVWLLGAPRLARGAGGLRRALPWQLPRSGKRGGLSRWHRADSLRARGGRGCLQLRCSATPTDFLLHFPPTACSEEIYTSLPLVARKPKLNFPHSSPAPPV